jgi:hypothetical protein
VRGSQTEMFWAGALAWHEDVVAQGGELIEELVLGEVRDLRTSLDQFLD